MSNINNAPAYWFIFFNDQLLLKKEGETYTIPCSIHPPVPVENVLEVSLFQDIPCRTAVVEAPLEETPDFLPMGLRASYDYLDGRLHTLSGKAYELIYWDRHSRFCPACGFQNRRSGAAVAEARLSPPRLVCARLQVSARLWRLRRRSCLRMSLPKLSYFS